jgi:transposase
MDHHPEFVARHSEVPWRSMRGMRNRIAHGYFDINLDVVWDTAQKALPELLDRLPETRARSHFLTCRNRRSPGFLGVDGGEMMQVLTDAQWAKFEAAIAAAKIRGARPRKEDRRTIEAIIWRLDNGAKWRSIPAELGNWHHAYLRFRRWAVGGVWDRIMAHVVAQGEPKLAFACIDGTVARAHQKAAGARSSKPLD